MAFYSLVGQLKTAVVKKTHTFVAAAAAASYSFVNVRPLKEGSKPSCPPSQSINFMQLVFYIHTRLTFFSCYEEKPRSNFFFILSYVHCVGVWYFFFFFCTFFCARTCLVQSCIYHFQWTDEILPKKCKLEI